MKQLISLIFITACSGFVHAEQKYLLVNIDNGNIDGIMVSPFNVDATNYIQTIVDADDPSLKFERRYQKWDFSTDSLTVKSHEEIQQIKYQDQLHDLKMRARLIQKQIDNAHLDEENGFSPDVDVADLENKKIEIKSEYDKISSLVSK